MPDPLLPPDAFCLGPLVVVPSLNRLLDSGGAVDLEPRVMRVLAVLAQTPGEVVTREVLTEAVWGDAVVNDESLTRAVSELRKALGAEASSIETIRGTGYRLARPVRPVAGPAGGARDAPPAAQPAAPVPTGGPGPRTRLLAGLALAVAAAALAVSLWTLGADVWTLDHDAQAAAAETAEPLRLDSTSQYYVPGLSERDVHYDSTADRHFWFTPD